MSQTFTAHGQTWTSHTPGDPCPCKEHEFIYVLTSQNIPSDIVHSAGWFSWGDNLNITIIGWRYADTPDQPKAEPTELERLQEENRLMREAVKEAHAALDAADGSSYHVRGDACLTREAVEQRAAALAKLQPFIKP